MHHVAWLPALTRQIEAPPTLRKSMIKILRFPGGALVSPSIIDRSASGLWSVQVARQSVIKVSISLSCPVQHPNLASGGLRS